MTNIKGINQINLINNNIEYNRGYFDGDSKQGYWPPGYQNFPSNYNIANKILELRPKSFLELGGCRGYISHILESQGIDSTNIDIAPHCWHTRACKKFILADATNKLPFKDKEFDLVTTKDFLEHIQEEKIPNIIKEMSRVSRQGFHLITFCDHPTAGEDITHKCLKNRNWWLDKFVEFSSRDYAYTIKDKEDFEHADLNIIKRFYSPPEITPRLNIGSFTQMIYNWENWDILDLSQWALSSGFNFKQVDITKQLPKPDNSIELINCSHTIEHLSREEGLYFLIECHRILRPEGILRISIPDARIISDAYINNKISDYGEFNIGVEKAKDSAQSLWEMLVTGHKTLYDAQSLIDILKEAGFQNIKQMNFLESQNSIIEKEVIDQYPEISSYIEARKKDQSTEPIINYGITTRDNADKLTIKDKLSVALISTPFFTIPPKGYSGLEQVIWDLACALDELGHHVTIFGPQGSQPTKHGQLIETGPSINTVGVNWLEEERKRYNVYKDLITPEKYDIIHDHSWFAFPYLLKINNPRIKIIKTHHGGFNWDSLPNIKPNLVAISKFMAAYTEQYFKQKGYNIKAEYVYNGIDLDKYPYQQTKTEHLLFVGRLSTFKQPHIAVEIARKTNHKLDIIGGTFVDNDQYVMQLEKLVEHDPNITIFKDAPHSLKIEKMKDAKALLFPSRMNEPFGLCALEAMSCGTPVIALDDGAISEVIIHSKTGWVCKSVDEMIHDVREHIPDIKPEDCRARAEQLSRKVMAENYIKLYQRIIRGEEW